MAPEAGEVLGEPELERPLFGSGGGGVVQLGGSSGPGGAGGGLLILSVTRAEVAEGGRVAASGEDGSAWAAGTWTYGAGGGAGGSLILEAQTLVLGAGTVEALGGAGYADVDRPGGDGGFGRIRVGCDTVNGVACADGGFDGLVEPTPWVGE